MTFFFLKKTVNFILPFVLYFVSRKYVASVEPIVSDEKSLYPNEKNLSAIKSPSYYLSTFPSAVLPNPDNNDVRMFNPDDNYSISIKRSSIRLSKHSQMEQSSMVYSPMVDNKGIPTIVYSDITSFNEINNQSPGSPNNLKTPERIPLPSSSQITHSKKKTNGLGIFDPVSEQKSGVNEAAQDAHKLSDPGSPRSFVSNKSKKDQYTHKMGMPFLTMPTSPEITEAPPASPNKSLRHNSSLITSALSFKSSGVAGAPEMEVSKMMTEEEAYHENNRFIAFQSRRGFNPFYLAIVSCTALSVSIAFMIVFDVTMLALGDNVLG